MPKYQDKLDLKVVERIEQTSKQKSIEKSPFVYRSKRPKKENGEKVYYDNQGKRPVMQDVMEGRIREVVDNVRLLIKTPSNEENEWYDEDEAKDEFGNWQVNQAVRNYLDRKGELEL